MLVLIVIILTTLWLPPPSSSSLSWPSGVSKKHMPGWHWTGKFIRGKDLERTWRGNQKRLGYRHDERRREEKKKGSLREAFRLWWPTVTCQESHGFQGEGCHSGFVTLDIGWAQPGEVWPQCKPQHKWWISGLRSWGLQLVMPFEVGHL